MALAPGIFHRNRFAVGGEIQGQDITATGFLVRTQKGPLATPTLVTSFPEFKDTFGSFQADSDAAYAVQAYFENGGQRAYIVRLAHYTDIDTAVTAAATADTQIQSGDTPADILDITAKDEGVYGNDISIETVLNPKASTGIAAAVSLTDTVLTVDSTAGMYVGQVLLVEEGVNSMIVRIQGIASSVSGVTVTKTITVEGGSNFAYTIAATVISQEFDLNVYLGSAIDAEETHEQLTLESDNANYISAILEQDSVWIDAEVDYTNAAFLAGYGQDDTYYPAAAAKVALTGGVAVGTIDAGDLLGSAAGSQGLYALESIDDIRLIVAIPDSDGASYAAAYHVGALGFIDRVGKRNAEAYLEMDPALTPAGAIAAKDASGIGGEPGSFGSVFVNRGLIVDPIDGVQRYISLLGHITGARVRVDAAADGGQWVAAAGVAPRGNLEGLLGVEQIVNETNRGLLNDAHINLITTRKNQGVLVYGVRSLDDRPGTVFRANNAMHSLIFIQQSITEGLQYAVFANNDALLAQRIKNDVSEFLTDIWKAGGLRGSTVEEAFSVRVGEGDGVQTAQDTRDGIVRAQIGLALQQAAEFVFFDYSEVQQ